MVRLPSLLRSTCFAVVWILVATFCPAADPAPAVPPPPTAQDLIGLARADVVTLLGKPTGERQRGDESIMVYADGKRVVLRAGVVIAASGGVAGEIIGADGAKYVSGADGTLKQTAPPIPPDEASVPEAPEPVVPATTAAPTATVVPAGDADELPPGAEQVLPNGMSTKSLEDRVEEIEDPKHAEPPSMTKVILTFAVGIVFRLGLTLLVLRLAVHVVGVPFFWPDLVKVALLYLAVHVFMEGLGSLGGLWEFVPLFKLDDVVSFIILACSLTWFKVAGSGLTALKIAAATKIVVLGLMLAVGLALTFGLSAMK